MDGIGVGPAGPPVPPEALFSVIPYPMEREAPMMGDSQRYAFVSNNAGDTNVGDDPSSKSDLSEVEKPVVDKKVCLFVCFSSSNILCFRFLFIFYLFFFCVITFHKKLVLRYHGSFILIF